MKKIILIVSAYLVCWASFAQVRIQTPNTEIIVSDEVGSRLTFHYFGNRLSDADFENLWSFEWDVDAYKAYGGWNSILETCLDVVHSDGNTTTVLEIESVSQEQETGAKVTRIRLKDKAYPFYVTVCYRAYEDVDMIETWTEIENREKKPVLMTRFDSGSLPIRYGNVWTSRLHGANNNEAMLVQEPLNRGMISVKNNHGIQSSHSEHPEIMFSLDGKPRENEGRVIGAALCYSGNYELRVEGADDDYIFFFAGIRPDNSHYTLEPKEVFKTPELALTYSDEGHSGASRNFHDWARKHKMAHGEELRKVVYNSWGAVHFDINEAVMEQLMDKAKYMGCEIFVVDDGWFGTKYPRVEAHCGLGDWEVDKTRLPNGLKNIIDMAHSRGLEFGIWVEPEMVNTKSELYEKHPDWVLQSAGRDLQYGRGGTQLVLDLCNPDVQDFIFGVFDNLLTENPGIDYIKWDANYVITNPGSTYLPKDRQSHMYIEYQRGLENVCKRIREKYPDLTLQACATGGGRVNYGVMPYFDEFWASDNTDALQRLSIQWGTSYFYPANSIAAHVSYIDSRSRAVSMKYRIDMSFCYRFGLELSPDIMTEAEIEQCRKAIAEYKEVRDVIQLGDLYRLYPPFTEYDIASQMYVSDNKEEAVFFWWKTEALYDDRVPRVPMAGLDPDKIYTVHELNRIDNEPMSYEGKSYSGKFLMEHGLDMPMWHGVERGVRNDCSSRVLHLVAE